ncbi:MAG: hypothetical protein V3R93_03520 [Candidatus Hydrothermarchaeaceae archaeon]
MSVKQKYIKRTAMEVVKRCGDEVTDDFRKNKDLLEDVTTIQGNFVKNRVAGYMVRLKKRKMK